jgi:D-3-phosphoglycerate dehydrogenase
MKIVFAEPIGIDSEEVNSYREMFKELGHDIFYYDHQLYGDELIERVKDADIIVVANQMLNREILSECNKLSMISVAFTGVDHIDLEYCRERNIVVSNAAGYSTTAVAELTIGLIFSLLRSIPESDKMTRMGYGRNGRLGLELKGKTLGIVGTGSIGVEVARLAQVFGVKIVGSSRSENREFQKYGEYCSLEELLSISDIVTLHLPLNDETRYTINESNIDLMKEGSYLINTARGMVIDSNALYRGIKSGNLAGAALDVYDIEPPLNTDLPILGVKTSTFTPHIGYATKEAINERSKIVVDNILNYFKGEIKNRVD